MVVDQVKVDIRPNPPRMELVWRIQNGNADGDGSVKLNPCGYGGGDGLRSSPAPPYPLGISVISNYLWLNYKY